MRVKQKWSRLQPVPGGPPNPELTAFPAFYPGWWEKQTTVMVTPRDTAHVSTARSSPVPLMEAPELARPVPLFIHALEPSRLAELHYEGRGQAQREKQVPQPEVAGKELRH